MVTKTKCYKNQVWINHISRYVLSSNFINIAICVWGIPRGKRPIWLSQPHKDNTRCSSWWVHLQAAHETPTSISTASQPWLTQHGPPYHLTCSESSSLALTSLLGSDLSAFALLIYIKALTTKAPNAIYVFPWTVSMSKRYENQREQQHNRLINNRHNK